MKALAQWKKHSRTVTRIASWAGVPREPFEQCGIGGQFRNAVDTQSLVSPGDQENYPDMGVHKNILKTKEQFVAPAVGNKQGVLVLHDDEPRTIALRRGVLVPIGVCRAKHQKRRTLDKVYGHLVQHAQKLLRRHWIRFAENRTQLFYRADAMIAGIFHLLCLLLVLRFLRRNQPSSRTSRL